MNGLLSLKAPFKPKNLSLRGSLSLEARVKKLFAAGEQGVWYDPSDVVNYTSLGSELVTNGDFSNGTTGWTAGVGVSIARSTAVFPDGGMLVTANGGGSSYGIQAVNGLTAGKRYVLSARVYSPSTNAANNRATIGIQASGFTSAGSIAQLATNQIQTISIQFIASGTSQTIYCSVVTSDFLSFGTNGSVAHFDNISVKELIATNPTMFQDAAGTTPVTAVEQPVGLILDKSKGLVLGPELITNGDFSAGDTGWIATGGNTTTFTSGVCTVVGTANSGPFQDITTTPGKRYRITYSISITSGVCSPCVYEGGGFVTTVANSGGNAYGFLVFTATTATSRIYFPCYATPNITIDNISVRELPGNHASQSTTTKRPILRARHNLLTYSEQFDNAAWTKLGTSTVTGSNTINTPASNDYLFWNLSSTYAGKQVTASMELSGSGVCSIGFYDNVSAFQLSAITLTATPTRYTFSATIGAGAVDVRCVVGRIGSNTATTITANKAQLNYGPTALPYQRIAAATDYDTVGFPHYLDFDGTDDSLVTANINFTGTHHVSTFVGFSNSLIDLYSNIYALGDGLQGNIPGGHWVYLTDTGYPGITSQSTTVSSSYIGSATLEGPGPIPIGAPQVFSGVYDCAGNTFSDVVKHVNISPWDVGRTWTQIGTGFNGTGTYGNLPLIIGRVFTRSFNGRIYSLILRGALSTANEIAGTKAWVNSKTGAY